MIPKSGLRFSDKIMLTNANAQPVIPDAAQSAAIRNPQRRNAPRKCSWPSAATADNGEMRYGDLRPAHASSFRARHRREPGIHSSASEEGVLKNELYRPSHTRPCRFPVIYRETGLEYRREWGPQAADVVPAP
jgi:hypothetical protein